jgi:flagellar motor switch protein FliN/FliY
MADDAKQPAAGAPATPAPSGAAAAEAIAGEALDAAQQAVESLAADAQAQPLELPDFGAGALGRSPAGISLLSDVNLNVKIELGRTRMFVEDVLRLSEGSVVELDKLAGDPVDIFVNDRHIARGEVLVLNDNFCVRVSEILNSVAAATVDTSAPAPDAPAASIPAANAA